MTASVPDGRPLVGDSVRLDVVTAADAVGLFAALDDARVYPAGFGGGPAGRPGSVGDMERWVAEAVADERRAAAYTVRLAVDGPLWAAGTIVGTSSLGDASLPDERIHLGWTAYAPSVWASVVNPECKLQLLERTFTD